MKSFNKEYDIFILNINYKTILIERNFRRFYRNDINYLRKI